MNDISICCFLSLCSTGDPEATAQELSVSQATVLRNVRMLEEDIGVPLFIGDTASGILTQAGKKFQRYFLDFADELAAEGRLLTARQNGESLHIGWCEWSGCPSWVLDSIRAFSSLNPNLSVSVQQAAPPNLLRFLHMREVDLIIASRYLSRGIKEACHRSVLQELPLFLVTASDLPLNERIDQAMASPLRPPLFVSRAWEQTEVDIKLPMERICSRLGWRTFPIEVEPNWDCAYLQTRLGCGITLSPINYKLERAGSVFRFTPLPLSITLVISRLQRNKSPAAAEFEQFLLGRKPEVDR